MMNAIRLALAVMILALPLLSCGKKSLPQAPGTEPQTYPRAYPYEPEQPLPPPPADSNQ
jgi:hypothetical protein